MDEVIEGKPILDRFRLEGRVALVTGAGQGIGRAYAHALGEAGASVAVVDIDEGVGNEVVAELKKKNIDSIMVRADVSDPAEVQAMVDAVVEKWGKLTIGVNNAGIGQWVDPLEVSAEDWRKLMRVNLDGVMYCAQAEGRVMAKAGYGKIINTASMSAHIINRPQGQTPYNVSKAGVLHMTRSLAGELADRGIRVNSISPGYTRTKLVEDLISTPEGKKMMDAWLPLIPTHRMGRVTDLQGAIVYLASEASDYMTGADLVIDGGYCVW